MGEAKKKVVVVGLGSMGSMALWQLSLRDDVEAIGVEQFGLSHGYGAFTGESRLFRTAYHEGAKYVPLLQRSRDLWEDLSAASGRRLLLNFGVLSVGEEAAKPFQRTLESIEKYGLPHLKLTPQQMRKRYPGMDFTDTEAGIIDLLGGAMRPELAVFSAVEQAQANGATVYQHEEVLEIEHGGADSASGSGVCVTTSERVIDADVVVVTSGAWTKTTLPEVEDYLDVRKLVLTWFMPRDLDSFMPDRFPCIIRDRNDFHIFGAPCVDGYSVKISGLDLWGGADTPRIEDADLRLDRDKVSEFGERVVDMFPGVHAEPNRFSVHFDTYTTDKTPIIDRIGSVVVATGFSGHGFKMAPAVGSAIASLAMDEECDFCHEDFRLSAHEKFDGR